MLTEYTVLKEEQKTRIGFRDNLLYVTLTVVAAVIAAAVQAKQPAIVLALPPVCVVLGWTYLVNDEKISAIGAYVRDELGPRLAQLAQLTQPAQGEGVFGWERVHRANLRRRSRKAVQCVIDLLAFCLVPLAGLGVYWAGGQGSPGLLVLSGFEAVSVVGLASQVIAYARPLR
ncbi:hypothetical protein [Streptomyces sp. SID12501]|uniref:Integral membrane protein n=1 Tax=Streptomyces sp. SID12501 TaxID=2706042 RepID=A0A6B3BSQ2_9ACTN|nr:hypothetical protein [Streptomyces sp. SID12501]NEC87377.1 hypothetical protein [Streptomyces sp. SID12501]